MDACRRRTVVSSTYCKDSTVVVVKRKLPASLRDTGGNGKIIDVVKSLRQGYRKHTRTRSQRVHNNNNRYEVK